jgi:hypothetical protein
MKGTIEQVKLFVAMCDTRVGVRRNRAAKRQAVLLVLQTPAGAEWSDRKVAGHCGVSHTFVGQLKARLNADQRPDADGTTGRVGADVDSPAVAVSGDVATQVAEGASDRAAVMDEGAAEVAPSGNVATSPLKSAVDRGRGVAMESGGTATRRRGRGGNVATAPDAAPAGDDQQAVPEPETRARPDGQGDQDSTDADVPGVLEGDADLASAHLFGEGDRVTVGDVERQVEALLLGCASDEERREALGQLLDALTGMLATFDEGDLSEWGEQEFDAE